MIILYNFQVTLPGLGFDTYFVRPGNGSNSTKSFSAHTQTKLKNDFEDIVIQNKVRVYLHLQ